MDDSQEKVIPLGRGETTDQRIALARVRQTRSLIKTVGVVIVLLVFLLSALFYFNSRQNTDVATSPVTESLQLTLPDEDLEVLRAQFKEELAQYESEVEPQMETIRLKHWAEEKYAELQSRKERAIEDFAGGKYASARDGLRQARGLAEEAAGEYVRRLTSAKLEAQEAFDDDRAPEAKKAAGDALYLKPDDPEMLALQKRIAVMPRVLDLLRQAKAAQNENRPGRKLWRCGKCCPLTRTARPLMRA